MKKIVIFAGTFVGMFYAAQAPDGRPLSIKERIALFEAKSKAAEPASEKPQVAAPAKLSAKPPVAREVHECLFCTDEVDLSLPADHPKAAIKTTPVFGCNHPEYFHAECLARWIQTNGSNTTCPFCRARLLEHIDPSSVPAIIQAALPGAAPAAHHHAAPAQPAAQVPSHITDIGQIEVFYNPENRAGGLEIRYANITSIDGRVFEQISRRWPNLEVLSLRGNPISQLPREIGLLRNLKVLSIRETSMRSLPDSVCELNRLEGLAASQSSLESLPPCFGMLRNLKYIELAGSLINDLPSSLTSSRRNNVMIDVNSTPLVVKPHWGDLRGRLTELGMIVIFPAGF